MVACAVFVAKVVTRVLALRMLEFPAMAITFKVTAFGVLTTVAAIVCQRSTIDRECQHRSQD